MTGPLVTAAVELLAFFASHGRPACLIGGMAVSRWGEPRMTQDVDATALVDFREEASVLRDLLAVFPSRDPSPSHRAEIGRLVLLTASNGVSLDVSFAAFPFEREVLQRASDWDLGPGIALRTCSAEDLIIYKLVAARAIDQHDVRSVTLRQGTALDVARIRLWGSRLSEITEQPELLEPFETVWRTISPAE